MRSEWHWFVRWDLQIFSGCVCHLEQLHAQSHFLFPIVFSINYVYRRVLHDHFWPCNAILFLAGRQRLPDHTKHITAGWKGNRLNSFGALSSKLLGRAFFFKTWLPLTTGRRNGVGWPNKIIETRLFGVSNRPGTEKYMEKLETRITLTKSRGKKIESFK